MRTSTLLSRLFAGGSLVALAAATGCAPERGDIDNGNVEGSDRMAVLASDESGRYDILLMDMSGNELQTVDSNLNSAVSLTWHPDGMFLVSDGSNIESVDLDGSHERFNQATMPSVVYRMGVTDDGDVSVSEEYDSTELDSDGELINHSTTGGTYCWMDAAITGDGGSPVLLDIFGSHLALWDGEADTYDIFASSVGASANILGKDGSGNFWTSSYEGRLTMATEDGDVTGLGQLSTMGIPSWGVSALEASGPNSVYALFSGDSGNGIAEVDSDGNADIVVEAGSSYWLDMVVY